jgi:hypothetical protein
MGALSMPAMYGDNYHPNYRKTRVDSENRLAAPSHFVPIDLANWKLRRAFFYPKG